jgi:hypothetical protein
VLIWPPYPHAGEIGPQIMRPARRASTAAHLVQIVQLWAGRQASVSPSQGDHNGGYRARPGLAAVTEGDPATNLPRRPGRPAALAFVNAGGSSPARCTLIGVIFSIRGDLTRIRVQVPPRTQIPVEIPQSAYHLNTRRWVLPDWGELTRLRGQAALQAPGRAGNLPHAHCLNAFALSAGGVQ